MLTLLPHLVMQLRYGQPTYVTNGDDHLYQAISRTANYGGWSIRDPFHQADEPLPILHATTLFAPFGRLARWLALPPDLILLVMRLTGASLLSSALFYLFWRLF